MKNEMKKFLKPTKIRLIGCALLLVFFIYLIFTLLTYFYDLDLPFYLDILYWTTLWPSLLFAALVNLVSTSENTNIWLIVISGLILEAAYSYLLVCLISEVVMTRKENKEDRKNINKIGLGFLVGGLAFLVGILAPALNNFIALLLGIVGFLIGYLIAPIYEKGADIQKRTLLGNEKELSNVEYAMFMFIFIAIGFGVAKIFSGGVIAYAFGGILGGLIGRFFILFARRYKK